MIEINVPGLTDANKGLTVCFILAILFANIFLIYTTVRKSKFLYKPKSLLLISMAIGDIFLALFPMVVLARALFEGTELELSCVTATASTVYLKFLIHFVYGFGLITMAVELVCRYKTRQKPAKDVRDVVRSLIFSAVPWFLGLIIILPITFSGMSVREDVKSTQQSQYAVLTPMMLQCFELTDPNYVLVLYGVSMALSPLLAVIVCFVVLCMRLLPAYYTAPSVVTYQNTAQAVVVTSQNANVINDSPAPHYPASNAVAVQHYPTTNPQGTQQYPSYPQANSQNPTASSSEKHDPNLGGPVFTSSAAQYPVQQYPPPAYPAQQYLPPQHLPPQYTTQQYSTAQFSRQQYVAQPNVVDTAPACVVQTQHPGGPALPDPGKEKNALVVVSIVHFLCVVPFAIFSMSRFISVWDGYEYRTTDAIADVCLFWLSIFRSLVTPLIFVLCNRHK
ncbi:hypothetical protein BsWGS_16231 [Bradybaena similaris]